MFYAQQKEDEFLWNGLWEGKTDGTFVDIGANDGVRFSNTYFFEQKGWTGICVEPNPETFRKLRQNRACLCVWSQVGKDCRLEADFWTTDESMLSSSNPNYKRQQIRWYGKDVFEGWKKVVTPRLTLDVILASLWIEKPINLLSIDVEGSELFVLAGLTLSRWMPQVVVVEVTKAGRDLNQVIHPYFFKEGYSEAGSLSTNYFFCRSEDERNRLVIEGTKKWNK